MSRGVGHDPADAEHEAAEVEETYRRYIQAYPQQLLAKGGPIDFDALRFWSFPLLLVACPASSIVVFDEPTFDAMVRAQYDKYRDDGWAGGAELDSVAVHSLQPGVAVLEGKGRRLRADGGVIDTWDAIYVLRKGKEGWRVVLITDSIQARPTTDQWIAWARSFAGGTG